LADREHGREQVLSFGPFQLVRSRKLLLRDGREVRLGSRAIELLTALVERAGEVVGKNELIAYVWPDTIVEENNLRVHITALRKCLAEGQAGARYIVNMAGRGYSFVAPISRSIDDAPLPAPPPPRYGNLPASLSRPVGRGLAVETIAHLLVGHRLVTVVGPGGIGKSAVALDVAERIGDRYADGPYFVDLAAVTDPALVVAAVASAVGASAAGAEAVAALAAVLRDMRVLLLVDNCEHVIDGVADVIERLLRTTSHLTVLATSREPLQADGEQIYQLSALPVPPPDARPTASEALRYPGVQLFVDRATNGFDNFALTDANAAQVSRICQRLDGVPLAIEIVAARAGLVGLAALELGDEGSELLAATGRRTASNRHRSLRATLDWSYRHLTSMERRALRRLSVFGGWFTLTAAVAVIVDQQREEAQALEAVMSLATKSLLSTDISGQECRYRLLHMTRLYSAELLDSGGDALQARRLHARRQQRLLEDAMREQVPLARARWLQLHRASIEDVRAAIQWSLGTSGEELLGAHLVLAALAFGFQVSLMEEFKSWTEAALAALRRAGIAAPELEVRLTAALGMMRNRTADADGSVSADIDRMIAFTREGGTPKDVIWPLSLSALVKLDFGDYAGSLQALADLQAAAATEDDVFARLSADRVGAMVCHWAGDHGRARQLAERVLRHPAQTIPPAYVPVSVDRRVSMRVVLARVLWLEGYADQARDIAAEALELAALDSPGAVCDALGHAVCPIAFWRGDVAEAARMSAMLLEHARRFTLTRWFIAASCLQAVLRLDLQVKEAGLVTPEALSQAAPLPGLQRDFMATISGRWLDDVTTMRGDQQLGGWCTAEIQRRAAEIRFAAGALSAAQLEVALKSSLQLARAQGAFAWQLRTATALARHYLFEEERATGRALLDPLVACITEGRNTADAVQAQRLLAQLHS
jgi:predicted ATPase/DNA-binding winged helix-turn-helix (wHTH) protein